MNIEEKLKEKFRLSKEGFDLLQIAISNNNEYFVEFSSCYNDFGAIITIAYFVKRENIEKEIEKYQIMAGERGLKVQYCTFEELITKVRERLLKGKKCTKIQK